MTNLSTDQVIADMRGWTDLKAYFESQKGRWDDDVVSAQAAYAALSNNLIAVADGRHHFEVTWDPASDGSQTGNGGTYPTLASIFADAPDYCFLEINMLASTVYEIDEQVLTGWGQDISFFFTESAAEIANRPTLRFTTYNQNGYNYKNRIRLRRGSTVSFRSVNIDIPGKIEAGDPWSQKACIQGWYFDQPNSVGIYKNAITGADGTALVTAENGSIILVSAFEVSVDGAVSLAALARGAGVISTQSVTLANGASKSIDGTLGTTLIEK